MIESTFLITEYQNGIISLLFQNQKLQEIGYDGLNQGTRVGNIYNAKVIQVVPNLNAAFVEISPDEKCFLPLEKINTALIHSKTDKKTLSITQGMEIPIQIEKPKIKTKDCAATMNLSLSGEYIVVSCLNRRIGFAEAFSQKEKNQLKELLTQRTQLFQTDETNRFVADFPFGVIFRTASHAMFSPDHSIQEDLLQAVIEELQELIDKLSSIIKNSSMRTCYSLLYESPVNYEQILKRNYHTIDKIVTDHKLIHKKITDMLQTGLRYTGITELYQDSMISLKNLYSVNSLMKDVLSKKVWLASGAYLIIENVETMTVVDVNTGKNDKKAEKSNHLFNVNMEALPEIIRQIRLRHISGMILIDFMKMKSEKEYQALIEQAKLLTASEHIKTEFMDITKLGLMELVRKKEDILLSEQIVQDIS